MIIKTKAEWSEKKTWTTDVNLIVANAQKYYGRSNIKAKIMKTVNTFIDAYRCISKSAAILRDKYSIVAQNDIYLFILNSAFPKNIIGLVQRNGKYYPIYYIP